MMTTRGSRDPIFLQTGFRTGGTWLWSRFRASPAVTAFCEPFNEGLATLSAGTIGELTPERLQLNHPRLDAPYFEEYRPFLDPAGRGVRGYRIGMGLESYFREDDASNPGLHDYLAQLLDTAAGRGTMPVLKFTRALGRASWLRRHFPAALQVLLLRNPFLQFLSARRLADERGNRTFLMTPAFALSRALPLPAYRPIVAPLGIPYIPMTDDAGGCFAAYARIAGAQDFETSLRTALVFFMLSYERSIGAADLVVDLERLVEEPAYRASMQDRLSAATGIALDLSGARLPDGASIGPHREAIVAAARTLLASLPRGMRASIGYVEAALARVSAA